MTHDLDRLMNVMQASFDPHFREAWSRPQVEDSLAIPSTFMILVDEQGEWPKPTEDAAGFILARQAVDEIELLLVAVHPDFRGKGLARKLLQRFFAEAGARNAARVFLEMRSNNPAARLYASAGFEEIGRRPNYYRTITGQTIDAITFAREIAKSDKSCL